MILPGCGARFKVGVEVSLPCQCMTYLPVRYYDGVLTPCRTEDALLASFMTLYLAAHSLL